MVKIFGNLSVHEIIACTLSEHDCRQLEQVQI
jgi:hypothetical protein